MPTRRPQGFAALDPATRRQIAAAGGRRVHADGKAPPPFTAATAHAAGLKSAATRAARRALASATTKP